MNDTTIALRFPDPLVFTLVRRGAGADDEETLTEHRVPLPTRGQMRRVAALDRDGRETAEQLDEKRAAILAIVCEGTDLPLDTLSAEEEVKIVSAIMAAHHGFDATDAVAYQSALLKKKLAVEILALAALEKDSAISTSPPSSSLPS